MIPFLLAAILAVLLIGPLIRFLTWWPILLLILAGAAVAWFDGTLPL